MGAFAVGKTAYVRRLLTDEFNTTYDPTIGVELSSLVINGVRLDIWDLAGQERYNGVYEGYLHRVDGILCMYDSTLSLKSVKNVIRTWSLDSTPTVWIRSKCDIHSRTRAEPDSYNISTKDRSALNEPLVTLIEKMSN